MLLLEVKNLKVHFPVKHGMFSRVRESVKAVDDVSFSIAPGETLGLVGDMADRVAVMYAGQIVELSPAHELLRRPMAKPECSKKIPELLEVEPGRFVRCPFWINE